MSNQENQYRVKKEKEKKYKLRVPNAVEKGKKGDRLLFLYGSASYAKICKAGILYKFEIYSLFLALSNNGFFVNQII